MSAQRDAVVARRRERARGARPGWLVCVAALGLGGAGCTAASACLGGEPAASSAREVTPGSLSLAEVAAFVRSGDGLTTVLDANGIDVHRRGHVPTSRWVPYDGVVPAHLPADHAARVVFYCASPQCSASTYAARRAIALGWTHVYVMPEGISGWTRAGLPIERDEPGS